MKKILTACFFLFIATLSIQAQEDFRKTPPKPGPAPDIQMGDYQRFELKNGLDVIVVENHKLPRVSFRLFIDVPLRLEKGAAGLSDLAGQMLRTGTTTRTKADIDEAIDFIGASLSTNANGLYASSLTRHQDELLEIMSDVLFNPSFSKEEFEKLKKQTQSALAFAKDDPNTIASNVAKVLRFGKDHPYGEIQTGATIENITLEKCKEYYDKYFKANLSYLIIVGDINLAEARSLAEGYFGDWDRSILNMGYFRAPEPPSESTVAFVNKNEAVQSVINITYPLQLKPDSEDWIAANLMNQVLGGNTDSRLQYNLREDKGYTYGASSSLKNDEFIGYFNAFANVRNEVTDSAISEFLYEMKRIREEDVSDQEIAIAKAKMAGAFSRSLENPQNIAQYALNTARFRLPADYFPSYLKKLNDVSKKDIRKAAQKYIHPDQAYILVVGNKNEVLDDLKQFDPEGKVDFYDIYGTKMQAVTAVLPEGLTGEQIIEKYIEAIGGRDKLSTVKDLTMTMTGDLQGQTITVKNQQKDGKMTATFSLAGSTLGQRIFDGQKGVTTQMGVRQPMSEQEVEDLKFQALPFPELQYEELGVKARLIGFDNIDGRKVYEVVIRRSEGVRMTEYFDAQNFLKLRTVQTMEALGQKTTQKIDYGAYQSIDGIQFPHSVTISGLLAFPLKTTLESAKMNSGIPDEVFNIE